MITHFIPGEENKVEQMVYQTPLAGLLFVEHTRFNDERGFYSELAHIPEIERVVNHDFKIKQLNLSHSEQNVIRGFHAENWNKLLTVTHGSCFCAWVDLRPESPTFKDVVTMQMGLNQVATFGSVYVDTGIGNSFCVTEGPVDYLYGVDQLYAERDTSGDIAISLFDPELNISWPIPREQMIISQRDLAAVRLADKF